MADYEPLAFEQAPTTFGEQNQASDWYISALERLVGVVRELSQARDVDSITAIVRDAARELTGADGATFVLREGEQCFYADENAIAPLWKGKRFPLSKCVSGWVMLHAKPAVIEDIYVDPRVLTEAYRPTFVKSMAMVPIRQNAPVGAIGNYWSRNYRPSQEQLAILQALADTTSVALESADLYAKLNLQVQVLENQRSRIEKQHGNLEVLTMALAHDLKEPVRTLVCYSGMLDEPQQTREEHETYVSYILNAASRMDMLIETVGRYVRFDDNAEPERLDCDLGEIVENVRLTLATLFRERNASLRYDKLPRLNADPAHLNQLLQNLIGNAVVHNDKSVMVTIGHKRLGKYFEFSVCDNGIGLNPGQQEQIFLPFRRLTHLAGCSGLGLAICRRIVALYGGEIRCESAPNNGATFFFTLPATEQAKLEPGDKPED